MESQIGKSFDRYVRHVNVIDSHTVDFVNTLFRLFSKHWQILPQNYVTFDFLIFFNDE